MGTILLCIVVAAAGAFVDRTTPRAEGPTTNLKGLHQARLVVEDLGPDAAAAGLYRENLVSETYVALRHDLPQLQIRDNAGPVMNIFIDPVAVRSSDRRPFGVYAVNVLFLVYRPVSILSDDGSRAEVVTTGVVWLRSVVLYAPPRLVASSVKQNIEQIVTQFAADYHKQNQ